jgi:hypothetical protein
MPIADFPTGLTTLLNKGWVRSFPVLEIQFNFDPVHPLYLSTVPLSVGDILYEDRLKKINSVKSSLNRSVDRAEIVIDNTDLRIGDIIDDSADSILENVPAHYYQVYKSIDGSQVYKIPKMSGILYTYSEDGGTDLNITLISDAYAGGGVAQYGVQQSCVWQYKDGINCTYSGTLETCDLTFNGPNGCLTHFGLDEAKSNFGGGATDLDEQARRAFQPFSGGGEGGPNENQFCFFGTTPIYIDDTYADRPIKEFKEGDPVLSFNKDTFETEGDTAQKNVFRHKRRSWYSLLFSDGAFLNVTPSHPFFPQPGQRVTAENLEVGMKMRRNVGGQWRTVSLVGKTFKTSLVPIDFYNVPVTKNHTYYANGFPVSNIKFYGRNLIP